MQVETENVSFSKMMITLGALLVCMGNTFATQQFFSRYWSYTFPAGMFLLVLGINVSLGYGVMKKIAFVSADKKKIWDIYEKRKDNAKRGYRASFLFDVLHVAKQPSMQSSSAKTAKNESGTDGIRLAVHG